jgi:hypothetical protein
MAEQLTPIDTAARAAHRQLLAALGLILLLGLAALLSAGAAGPSRAGRALWMILPVIIAITAVALRGMDKRVDKRALDAVRNDELRQASLQRAYRNGFFAVLALQPVLVVAMALGGSGGANAVALMATVTATLGTAAVLASLLWYDR